MQLTPARWGTFSFSAEATWRRTNRLATGRIEADEGSFSAKPLGAMRGDLRRLALGALSRSWIDNRQLRRVACRVIRRDRRPPVLRELERLATHFPRLFAKRLGLFSQIRGACPYRPGFLARQPCPLVAFKYRHLSGSNSVFARPEPGPSASGLLCGAASATIAWMCIAASRRLFESDRRPSDRCLNKRERSAIGLFSPHDAQEPSP